MNKSFFRLILPLSVAIFSMFFGAGNTIYPILLAVKAKSHFGWSFFGLILTAILGPLIGLIGGALFKGKSIDFFSRAGKWPGIILITASLSLLGPFAVLPRCVSVAYSAVQAVIPNMSLWFFVTLFCLITWFCSYKKKVLLSALGYILSPALIACLLMMIYKGWNAPNIIQQSSLTSLGAFFEGLSTGYDTMDLIASIIFSAGIWGMVSQLFPKNPEKILKTTLISGSLACLMLALIYLGLSQAAAVYADQLIGLPRQELMTRLAFITLGPKLGMVANAAVALACLTTVIGLTMTISDIISKEIMPKKISYKTSVMSILIVTAFMTHIGFETISVVIHSVVQICYPIIIVLTIYNITYKLRSFKTEELKERKSLRA